MIFDSGGVMWHAGENNAKNIWRYNKKNVNLQALRLL